MVFVLGAEAYDPLRTVHIEGPHRDAVFSGDPGKETRKGLGVVVIFDDEFAPA